MNPLEQIGDFFETLLGLPGKALSGLGAGLASAFGVCRTCGKSHPPGKHKRSSGLSQPFMSTNNKTPAAEKGG